MKTSLIIGTGLDETPFFNQSEKIEVDTSYGKCELLNCIIDNNNVIVLPRHGLNHTILPSKINYRANIAALKKLDVTHIIGICSVGSLHNILKPGSYAVLSDFIDYTKNTITTFYDSASSEVKHTDMTEPYCKELTNSLVNSCLKNNIDFIKDSVYIGVDGPRYETPAEVKLFASWGADVVGMTNIPECTLSREAGICYAALAVVTNFASGISDSKLAHDDVRQSVIDKNKEILNIAIDALQNIKDDRNCDCINNNNGLAL